MHTLGQEELEKKLEEEMDDDSEMQAYEDIEELMTSGICQDIIRETYDNGK